MDDGREKDLTHRGMPFLITGPGGSYRKVWRADQFQDVSCWGPLILAAIVMAVLLLISAAAYGQGRDRGTGTGDRVPAPQSLVPLLNAIRHVESRGDASAVGDGGKAIGPYQVHRDWWIDSGGSRHSYAAGALDDATCRRRIVALWRKRCPAALREGNLEVLARTFRRPVNPWHSDNAAYWRRVRTAMGVSAR